MEKEQEMGNLSGRVAFITGVARGQGRSHALRLAQEGADIIGVDICQNIESVPYALATKEDLQLTVSQVEALGRRIFVATADVRSPSELRAAYDEGVARIGPVDVVVANAGICPVALAESPDSFRDVIDVNLVGVFNTLQLVAPDMIERGRGGSIVLTGSTAGASGSAYPSRGLLGYVAAKHGVVGLMKSYANLLGEHSIRVNVVHPTAVDTPMAAVGSALAALRGDSGGGSGNVNALPVGMVQPEDIANAVAWLVSDEARYVTGTALPVDAGYLNKR